MCVSDDKYSEGGAWLCGCVCVCVCVQDGRAPPNRAKAAAAVGVAGGEADEVEAVNVATVATNCIPAFIKGPPDGIVC